MAYIHVKRVGNKKYYSLRVSARKGPMVITKDLCNLGSDISKIKIDELEKKYRKDIRSSYRTIKRFLDSNYYLEKAKKSKIVKDPYFSKEQLLEIKAILLHYNSRFLKLDSLSQEEAMETFMINFAVNSTSIEGNTITLKQAHSLFKEDIIPKNKTLREVHDLTNTKEAWEFVNKDFSLSLDYIEKVHDILLKNIDKRKGYRAHDIRIFGQPFKPSPARYVRADMKLLLEWYKKSKMHPLALAAFFHHKFENIHPFSDGNGRTGRILMNFILMSSGYPPLIISQRFRKEYLAALNEADKSLKKGLTNVDMKHYRKLVALICWQFKASYWDTFLF
ncbi:MAG: Fic family protein [Candidatus Woesearchaeota archaeon]